MLETCVLSFTNERDEFYGGDVVSGTISFTLFKRKKLSGGSSVILEPGNHVFDFSFILPEDVPTSLDEELGSVKYSIKVTASRSMKFDDVFRHPFSVITKYDLNAVPQCAVPAEVELTKSFFFLLSSKGAASIKAYLPRTGFVPGQSMDIRCEIKNYSEVKIYRVEFQLMQKRTYKCTYPNTEKKERFDLISSHYGEGVGKKMEDNYTFTMDVPYSVPPTTRQSHGLITTTYYMKVKAVFSGFHSNISDTCYITIGTVPFNSDQDAFKADYTNLTLPSTSYPQPELDIHEPSAPPPEPTEFGGLPGYQAVGLPTYEESQMSHNMMTQEGQEDDKDSAAQFGSPHPVYGFQPLDYTNDSKNDQRPNIGFNIPKD